MTIWRPAQPHSAANLIPVPVPLPPISKPLRFRVTPSALRRMQLPVADRL